MNASQEQMEQPEQPAPGAPQTTPQPHKPELRGKSFEEQEAMLTPPTSASSDRKKRAPHASQAAPQTQAAAESAPREAAEAAPEDNEFFDPAKHMAAMAKDYQVAPQQSPAAPTRPEELPAHLQATDDAAKAELQQISEQEMEVAQALMRALQAQAEVEATGDAQGIEQVHARLTKLQDAARTLQTRRDALDAIVADATTDLEIATSPASAAADLDALCARRGVPVSAPAKHEEAATGWQFAGGAWKRKAGDTATRSVAAHEVTQSDEVTDTIGLGGASSTRTQTTAVATSHGASVKSTQTSTAGIDAMSGSVSWGSGTSTERSDASGAKTSTTTDTSTTVGIGGLKRQSSTATNDRGAYDADVKTTSVTRGDGKIGVGHSREVTQGTATADGKLEEGSTAKVAGEAGLIASDTEIGGSGGITSELTEQTKSGVKTGVSSGLSGRFTLSVTPIDSASDKYKLILSLKLGASIGTSGSATKGQTTKGSAGFSAGAAASVTAVYAHVMSGEEVKKYQANLGIASGGSPANGQYPEFAIMAAGVTGGWEVAKRLYQGATAAAFDSDDIAAGLQEGDDLSLTTDLGAQGGVTLGASQGASKPGVNAGPNFGLSVGASNGQSIKLSKGMKDGMVIYGVEITDRQGSSVGGSAGMGVASMGLGSAQTSSQTSSVRLKLDPKSPNAGAIAAQLNAAKTRADIDAIIRKYPELVSERSTATKEGDTDTTSASVGIAKATVTSSAEREHRETINDKGEKTVEDTGSNSGGMTLGVTLPVVGELTVGASSTESLAGTVTHGKAKADLTQTDQESDLLGTVLGIADAAKRSPLSLLTGAASEPKETKTVAGMALSDGDIEGLMARAQDPKVWMKGMHSGPDVLQDYQALGRRIRAAGDDKEAVVKAMTDFVGTQGSGRDDMVRLAVRGGAGGTGGGSAYYFPARLGDLKATYDAVVIDDPVEAIDEAEAAAKKESPDASAQAMTKATGTLAKLDRLEAAFRSYTPTDEEKRLHTAAMQEMLAKIAQRKEEVRTKIRILKGGSGEATLADNVKQYNDLLSNCIAHKDLETSSFDKIAQLNKEGHEAIAIAKILKQIRDLYVIWDREFAQMTKLAEENKIGLDRYFLYQPDRARFNKAQVGAPGPANALKRPNYQPTPMVAQASADPVGESFKKLDEMERARAAEIRGQLNAARLKASAAYNTLSRRVQGGGQSAGALQAHEAGRKLFNSAEARWQKLQKGASVQDLSSYGFIAMEDFNAAYDTFKRGQDL